MIRRKNQIAAIDAFQQAELKIDDLFLQDEIPSSLQSYYLNLRYQAILEKAHANLITCRRFKRSKKANLL